MAAPTLQMPGSPITEDEVVFSKVTFWTRFRRHKLAIAGSIVLLLMVLAAVFAGQISPYDPNSIDNGTLSRAALERNAAAAVLPR